METFTIVYEDTDVLVCKKPAGIPVQTRKLGTPDMETLLMKYLMKNAKGKKPYLATIHRLDQPVSGLLVFAKTPAAAKALNAQLTTDGFSKDYEAIVCGIPSKAQGTLNHYLVKDGKTNTSRVCSKDTPGAKLAALDYQVIETIPANRVKGPYKGDLARVRIHLHTGRHHQIRVQMAANSTPLWGDNKYNDAFAKEKGYHLVALCARHLSLCHPVTNKSMDFEIDCNWSHIFEF